MSKKLIMQKLRTSDKIYLSITIVAISGWLIYSYLMLSSFIETKQRAEETKRDQDWCYVETIQPGGHITETKGGSYTYSMVVTSKGIEVYRLCTNSHDKSGLQNS